MLAVVKSPEETPKPSAWQASWPPEPVQTQHWKLWCLGPHRKQIAITQTKRITILSQLPQIVFEMGMSQQLLTTTVQCSAKADGCCTKVVMRCDALTTATLNTQDFFNVMLCPWGSGSLLRVLDPEDEGTMIFQSIGNYTHTHNCKVCQHIRLESWKVVPILTNR